ncbi:hypothetical protein PGT21_009581 [Puccinia graminis f. sp. tritici]|uniref:Uncharacterized protein n=2 Tax=Puccinia graminis f. sp. tritici TaxID=56615 RepID=H6QPP8_PUCGT|nr:uncharacterized protein PGTG_20802 [Puccinia graminis f. sp. tritici CRL 75-36-700-3]EHS64100.1 hypothetical protein PGTG_20802 [Puccinia graminis f. sp. tritici CRL 75-36-700-3]KAA1118887.1 hypothetical protein PGT21_009581 [Puccinia graminis f. sp. tritici]
MSSSPHSQRVTRRQAGRDHRWDRDAINGGPSSLTILLNWLTTPGNYSRWDAPGNPDREGICMEILELMENEGIHHRHVWGINHRIQLLRRSYNTARNFIAHAQREPNIHDGIILLYARRVCPHWDLLHPIMGPQTADTHDEQAENINHEDTTSEVSEDESTNTS